MAKTRVALIFGGVSSEYEISCISGAAICDNLSPDKYEVFKIGITQKGRWLLYPGGTDAMRNGTWHESADCAPAFISPDRTSRGIVTSHGDAFDVVKIDVAFPALHGRNGEDGTIQGLFELAGIPYVGCGVLASAACMDKALANAMFDACGIVQTPWLTASVDDITDTEQLEAAIEEEIGYPLFVKPSVGGSSVGITKVKRPEDLQDALLLAAAHDTKILLERAVDGMEVECAVLGNRELQVTYPGEIVPCNEIYDYEAKYKSGSASKLYIPARLPQEKLAEVRDIAERAYRAMGCEGMARVDFFVESGTGRVLLNEINTIPGFTTISMYPKLMEHAGVPFPDLCDRLVELAFEEAGL